MVFCNREVSRVRSLCNQKNELMMALRDVQLGEDITPRIVTLAGLKNNDDVRPSANDQKASQRSRRKGRQRERVSSSVDLFDLALIGIESATIH